MNKILLLLLFTVPALAQNGFRMEKGKMIWEHTFATIQDINTLVTNVKGMSTDGAEGNVFKGKGAEVKSTVETESIRLKSDANFTFTITVVPGGYVVKVSNYVFLEKYGPLQMRIVQNPIEKYYVEYSKIRQTPKSQNDLHVLDGFLTGVFSGQAATADAVSSASISPTTMTAK
jgi:hypothetical protein